MPTPTTDTLDSHIFVSDLCEDLKACARRAIECRAERHNIPLNTVVRTVIFDDPSRRAREVIVKSTAFRLQLMVHRRHARPTLRARLLPIALGENQKAARSR
jgi:hypothetical protein